jgi:hypothetical protein
VDRARVLAELQGRVGVAATLASPPTGNSVGNGAIRAATGKFVVAGCTALAVVASVVLWMPRQSVRTLPQVVTSSKDSVVSEWVTPPPKTLDAPIAPNAPAVSQEPEVVAEHVTKKTAGVTVGSRAPIVHDSISEEAAILARAQSELRHGRAAQALQILAEHERRFKQGILSQERKTVRIQALCQMGRVAEANALMRGVSPQSLTGQSVRQACSSLPSSSPTK